MHHPIPAARIRQRDTIYRIEDASGLCVRLHCVPAPAGAGPDIRARLDLPQLASWFPTRQQAELVLARFFGAAGLEVVRSDA